MIYSRSAEYAIRAFVHLAQVQEGFRAATKGTEEQRAAIMMAAVRTESLATRLGKLAEAEPMATKELPYVAARALPDIPFSLIAAGSVATILIFFVGLMVPFKKEELGAEEIEEEKRASWYRRAG